jgi:hypothetical protein
LEPISTICWTGKSKAERTSKVSDVTLPPVDPGSPAGVAISLNAANVHEPIADTRLAASVPPVTNDNAGWTAATRDRPSVGASTRRSAANVVATTVLIEPMGCVGRATRDGIDG